MYKYCPECNKLYVVNTKRERKLLLRCCGIYCSAIDYLAPPHEAAQLFAEFIVPQREDLALTFAIDEQDVAKHQYHGVQNVYWGGCAMCDAERVEHEEDLKARKITHLLFQGDPTDGCGDTYVLGLVEHSQFSDDVVVVWESQNDHDLAKRPHRTCATDLVTATSAIAQNPLTTDAAWVEMDEWNKMVNMLPPGRTSQAYVYFGEYDDWGR
jgi:hypothetical protein